MFFYQKINLKKYKNIVILTGAGISAASGLKTYRGITSDRNNTASDRGHVDRLKDNPLSIW